MKKIILALIVLTTFSQGINAQDTTTSRSNKPLQLSFGVNAGAPLGDNSKTAAFVIGGDLLVAYGLSNSFRLSASAGIDARINKGGVVNTIYYAPVLGGFRFNFTDKIYVSEQAGYSLGLTKGLDGVFTNQAGIGVSLSNSSDILLAYKSLFGKDGAKDFNSLVVRLAYVFGR